jgi:cobalt-zinc-cadmium resistance protein CzcA
MPNRNVVSLLLRHRFIVMCVAVLLCGIGWWSMLHIARDSFPDITPIRVEVDTEVDGMAAEEIEKLITYPIEQALRGIPNAAQVRSKSKFSLSVVEVLFEPDTDLYWARSQVFQNLGNATLPSGVTPQMAPMDEGSGQIFIYTLTSKKLDNMQLRTLQDYDLKPALRAVPGVADVPMFGGYVKQYQVVLDPARLTNLGLGVTDVISAINANNVSQGGNYLRRGSTQYVIRGIGFVRTLDDIGNITVSNQNGVPIRVRDLATVRLGPEDRQGAVSVNGQGEAVAGIVIKRLGENTAEVIERVKKRLGELQKSLQAGSTLGMDTSDVNVVTIYDQSYLIDQSTHTVIRSLLEGAVLIILLMAVFTSDVRVTLIPICANVFCIVVAFALMKKYNVSANLLSLGGIALSLGMMVDASIMILENCFRHIREEFHPGWTRLEIITEATDEILRPTVLAVLVIICVFVPVLSLKGIEGDLFIPLALAVVYSMFGSLLMAIAVAPCLCYYLLPPQRTDEAGPGKQNAVMRFLQGLYAPPLEWSVRHPFLVMAVATVVLGLSILTFWFTGSEFLPPLEEGNMRLRFTYPPSMSLPYAMDITNRIEKKILATLPEAELVVSYVGRPELGGDPESISNDEVYIRLKPPSEWRAGVTKEQMQDQLRSIFSAMPGTTVQFSQELEMRTDEMISGFNTPITIYVLGEDPEQLESLAQQIKKIASEVPGTADVGIEHLSGVDNLDITPNRATMSRYGASVQNVMDVVNAAVGGGTAGQVYLQNQRFDINVRMRSDVRNAVDPIKRLLVATSGGAKVPLEDVADIHYGLGFDHVDRYNGKRRLVVMADVKGRSVGSVVADIRERINADLKLPGGYSVFYGGQAEEATHAFEALSLAVPAALLVVFLLIYLNFDDLIDTLIVLSTIPLGIAGGTFLLMIMHLHLNVPAYIGFIAKFGIAVQNGMIMVTYMNRLRGEGLTARAAAVKASLVRLRPELLSALIGSIGLVPFLLASGTGATVERPLAAVVIGGVAVSRPIAWFMIPALYAWWKKDPPGATDDGLTEA